MIKRYNQFVKENVQEETELNLEPATADTELSKENEAEVLDNMDEIPTDVETTQQYSEEEEEVAVDPYEKALMDLAEVAGVEYEEGKKSVNINGKEVTFPTETEKYHVQGVKKPFNTAQEVVDYLNSDSRVSELSKEPSFEETEGDLARRDLESEIGKFESKSYKQKRFKN